ncbi:DUF5362 family protein [Aliikangiella sp. G2MR2-5]|uniref:DUF5362 family protein n=1 Tax=Aliikangiella sp. G2MR2-5 TaxID=2788943 RepID=UPI0018AC7E8A|nr:DUF5362 family protein [Aliikangiella sp. G2MR2-5]
MSDQHYAPPQANLQSKGELETLLQPLRETKGWARMCSIMGFIGCGFMILAGIAIMVGGAAFQQAANTNTPTGMGIGIGIGMGLFYLVFALLYFFPSLYLFRYSSRIQQALVSQSIADIAAALEQQKSFWKFAGIIVLIMFVFFAIGMVSAILIPLLVQH